MFDSLRLTKEKLFFIGKHLFRGEPGTFSIQKNIVRRRFKLNFTLAIVK